MAEAYANQKKQGIVDFTRPELGFYTDGGRKKRISLSAAKTIAQYDTVLRYSVKGKIASVTLWEADDEGWSKIDSRPIPTGSFEKDPKGSFPVVGFENTHRYYIEAKDSRGRVIRSNEARVTFLEDNFVKGAPLPQAPSAQPSVAQSKPVRLKKDLAPYFKPTELKLVYSPMANTYGATNPLYFQVRFGNNLGSRIQNYSLIVKKGFGPNYNCTMGGVGASIHLFGASELPVEAAVIGGEKNGSLSISMEFKMPIVSSPIGRNKSSNVSMGLFGHLSDSYSADAMENMLMLNQAPGTAGFYGELGHPKFTMQFTVGATEVYTRKGKSAASLLGLGVRWYEDENFKATMGITAKTPSVFGPSGNPAEGWGVVSVTMGFSYTLGSDGLKGIFGKRKREIRISYPERKY